MKKPKKQHTSDSTYRLSVLVFVIVLIFCGVVGVITYTKISNYQKDTIDNYLRINDNSMRIAKNYITMCAKEDATLSISEMEDKLVKTDMSRLDTGYSKFWFLASNEELLYYNGTSIYGQLVKAYETGKYEGSMIIKQNNSEIVYSITTFEIEDNVYYFGYTTDLEAIFSGSGVDQSILWIVIADGLLVVILLATTLFMINISKSNAKNMFELNNVVKDKNITIESITKKSEVFENSVSIRDKLTGLYNMLFLTKFLNKIDGRKEIFYKICIIKLENQYLSEEEFEKLELSTAKKLKEIFAKDDVLIRFSKGIYVVVIVNHNQGMLTQNMNTVLKYIYGIIEKGDITIGVSCTESNSEENAYQIFGKALKQVN